MKRLIPILMMLISLSVVIASPMPCPFSGKVSTIPESAKAGLTMELAYTTNLGSTTWNMITNEDGQYQFDIGGDLLCQNGMQFTLDIKDCNEPQCTKVLTFYDPGLMNIDFDLVHPTTTTATSTTIETTVPTTVETTTTIPCPNCDSCCAKYPEITYEWLKAGGAVIILGIIAAAIGAYKGRVQIRFYQKYYDPIAKKYKYHWVILFSRSD